jgi:hypothetical protein
MEFLFVKQNFAKKTKPPPRFARGGGLLLILLQAAVGLLAGDTAEDGRQLFHEECNNVNENLPHFGIETKPVQNLIQCR